MPGLTTLHHVDVLGRVEVTATGTGSRGGFFSVFAPKVGLSDIVIVGNRHDGTVFQDLTKLHPELKPAISVFGVVIRLIAGKEQEIRIKLFQVVDHHWSGPRCARTIARQVADDNHVFVDGVFADQAFELCFLTMADAIGNILGVVPVLDSKVSAPAKLNDGLRGDLLPLSTFLLQFKRDLFGFVGHQGEQLC